MSECEEPEEPKFVCTFKELAQIALGCPKMEPINISALNSLLQALVTKLDCQDDKLTLKGCEAKCGEELLQQADTVDVPRFCARIEDSTSLYFKKERIHLLNERIGNAENKLRDHLHDIVERTTLSSSIFHVNHWGNYASLTEDLCVVHEEYNTTNCTLTLNTHFLRRLARNIMTPILRRMKVMQGQLAENHKQMEKMQSKLRRHHEELNTVSCIVRDIELMQGNIEKRQQVFIDTMKEIQEILDCKVDKLEFPIIKKYVKDRFEAAKKLIAELRAESPPKHPNNPFQLQAGTKCLSCGGLTQQVAGVRISCQMPCEDLAAKKVKEYEPEENDCMCDYQNFSETLLKPLMNRIENMTPNAPTTRPESSTANSSMSGSRLMSVFS